MAADPIGTYMAQMVALARINPALYRAVRARMNLILYASGRSTPDFVRAGIAIGLHPSVVNTYLAGSQGDFRRVLVSNGYGFLANLTPTASSLNTVTRLVGAPTLPMLPGATSRGPLGNMPAASSGSLNTLLSMAGQPKLPFLK